MNSFRISSARLAAAAAAMAVALLASTAIAQTRGSGRITGRATCHGEPVIPRYAKSCSW